MKFTHSIDSSVSKKFKTYTFTAGEIVRVIAAFSLERARKTLRKEFPDVKSTVQASAEF